MSWELLAPRIGAGHTTRVTFAAPGFAIHRTNVQGVLRNPLAEPYLLGVSGGAAVGAVLVTAAGATALFAIAPAAFAGAAISVFIVLALARLSGGRFDPRVLLMAGVVVGAFANATIMVALANADANNVRGALWWMMGSSVSAQWRDVARLGFVLAVVTFGHLLSAPLYEFHTHVIPRLALLLFILLLPREDDRFSLEYVAQRKGR